MTHRITIKGLDTDLKGYGYLEDKKISFPYVLPGQELKVEERGRGKRKYYKILTPSNYNPEITGCKYFTHCGGCRARHIPYTSQFKLKVEPLVKFYKNLYNLNLEILPSDKIDKYRNRMDFAIFPNAIGLRQEGNFRNIIDIEECKIQTDIANRELKNLRIVLQDFAYNRKTNEGVLKYLTLRVSQKNELLTILTFISSFKDSDLESKLIDICKNNSIAENIIFCYNRPKAEVSATGELKVIRGNSYYIEKFFDIHFEVNFDSFFQPNPSGFTPILNFIEEEIRNHNFKTLVDLFCGGGFFSLIFGKYFEEILGYDIINSSITSARKSLQKAYPEKKVRFEVLDLYSKVLPESLESLDEKKTILFVDPPRNGLGEHLIRFIIQLGIEKIFYISCNPISQKKDIEMLNENYKISRGLLIDPYPHTPHLESVLFLEKKHDNELK